MPKFPDLEVLAADYDAEALMDHLQAMYIDTHNILFMAAILALHDEFGLPFDDYLLSLFSRNHTMHLLHNQSEGRDLERRLGLGRPGFKQRQFEDLWNPESPRIALWYPQSMIDLVESSHCTSGKDINEAFRDVGELLGYSPGRVRQRYYHAKEGLDFVRRIDSPDFNNSFNDQFWDPSHDVEFPVPTDRTN